MTTKPSYTPALRFPDFFNDGEWEVKRLGEICIVNPPSKDIPDEFYYLDLESVVAGRIIGCNRIKREGAPSRAQRLVQKYDVLFQMVRPYQQNNLYFLLEDGQYVASTGYAVLKAKEGVSDSGYLYHIVHSKDFLSQVLQRCTGSNYPAINSSSLEDICVPFPPLPEQRRIAQALTALDELIAATNEKLEQMKAYKKGLMQQLFVDSMGSGKSLKINYLQIPKLRFPEFYQEKEWEEKKLGEIVDVYQGFGFPEKLQGKKKGKYPFIKVSDISVVTNKGDRFIEEAANYVDEEDLELLKAIPFPAGTVVFAKIGEAIRLNRRVILKQKSLIDNNVGGVKAKSDLSNDSFMFYIMSMIDLMKYAGGVVPSVKKTAIENIDCVIPSLPEQRKIASCLSAMDETINAYTEKVGLLGQYKKGLMQRMFPKQ